MMALSVLANALKEFELALDDLDSSFEFVRSSVRLRPRLREMLDWKNMDREAKELAIRFLSQGAAEESIVYRGLVISLAGAFEQFVRRIVRDAVLNVNKAELSFESLSETLRKQNVHRTGLAPQTVFEPVDYLELDYEALSRNIGTCCSGSKKAILNAEAFTIFLSIISPEKLSDALGRIGVKLQWDVLGKDAGVRRAFEKEDTRETAKAIEEFLKRFGQMRNKIAHTGSSGIVVTEADLEQLLRALRSVARALAAFVETQVVRIVSS